MCQQRTGWRPASRVDTAQSSADKLVSLYCGVGLDKLFERCSHTAWPGGHGPGLMVSGPQKLPAGLRWQKGAACVSIRRVIHGTVQTSQHKRHGSPRPRATRP
eukprot:6904232-Prymnesium_polylepis.1